MVESFITQCPHCGTSFRVRSEQLAVANGSVRCGACLQVFGARNHLVTAPLSATRPTTAKTDKPKEAAKPSSANKPKQRPPAAPEFAGFSADDDEFVFADGDDDRLFGDDESDEGFGELSDSFQSLNDSVSKSNRKVDHFQREAQALNEPELTDPNEQDERWAESILEELENDTRLNPERAMFDSRAENQRKVASQPESTSKPTALTKKPMAFEPDFPMTPTASQVVNKVNHAPDLDFHIDGRLDRLRPLGWVAVVALLLVLAGQWAWLERDQYARMDQWRGLYQSACDILGCSLPAQVDLDKIRSSLLVREHKDPNLKDMRMVDIVLTNRAPFKQAFPLLLLQYTDVNGKLVADQQYHPDEYLKGELTGVKLMPINTRIYVSLAIRTPVTGAVNYQLLLSPS
ncbi:MAG: putative Zn finger-like uncharacterized protein [Granulosicoccus sp.]|jgi:predicted Zn finger-like uncharacterized protein